MVIEEGTTLLAVAPPVFLTVIVTVVVCDVFLLVGAVMVAEIAAGVWIEIRFDVDIWDETVTGGGVPSLFPVTFPLNEILPAVPAV